ncbi:DNA gyrase/topoisomerase IV subunit A [Neolewinella aurantiaca]|uniref:DNA gyrase/topoisomerase IV subunit A n=1 Tax=Neolewinella aurantiaca TaxID=2602767 RepID=A0A5C7FX58_9BACT|nr:DNA gyrase/topoisomerase IV subunit A [Neolewinella aurantiaca]TXF89526.1 DNA gyrase/topoisomerase IV subunit A [Neolewinella aurantiaca]
MSDKAQEPQGEHASDNEEQITTLKGMYEDYFLDYASYVILERAVPTIEDGLKPVQRRILHALNEMHDGRYHKVANVIGQTMQYHPHGDAAIGDALVNMGQKDLMIDPQGNWGNTLTGDSAAASRYIEARLTKFATEVIFNPQTTEWQVSYDGRKKEPVNLPAKFPLVLAQGAEGIAVGLSTKIMPHNFIELCKESIKILQGKKPKIYPDFPTGGSIDVSDYQWGKRGGKIKIRAKIEKIDNHFVAIRELPYGMTTSSLIDSILKAVDKGKIRIKKVQDNTAAEVEILIELASGISPDVTIDALYAFTNCELSVSPNACVIIGGDKPHFISVLDILEHTTHQTKALLKMELLIKQKELEEKLHFASLEKIFIQERIYRDIEEAEDFPEVIDIIRAGLEKYFREPLDKPKAGDKRILLLRAISEEDIVRLTEIRIKRISKYNKFKADERMAALEEELRQVKHDLEHLTEYAIAWYEMLLSKYGKGRERKTTFDSFEKVKVAIVAANNAKLYVDRKEGFVGTGLKKEEFVKECSDLDDIIVVLKDGTMMVTRVDDKTFVGKNIIHVDVWRKGDERTTYNMIYLDGKTGRAMGKRFNVKAITRDRAYQLHKGAKGSKLLYFSANPNGEAEIVNILLSPASKARVKDFDFDFAELAIKGRASGGNIVTRYPVRKVTMKEAGKSTLGALKVWMDEVSGRLNLEERGLLLGGFDTGDKLLVLNYDGTYELEELDMTRRYDPKQVFYIGKYYDDMIVSAVYYEGERGYTLVKRFEIETSATGQKFNFITDHRQSKLYLATVHPKPEAEISFRVKRETQKKIVQLADFIDVKGWKSLGNKLHDGKLTAVKELNEAYVPPVEEAEVKAAPKKRPMDTPGIKPGDTIELEF